MKYVFWQPCASIHQADFAAALANRGHSVDFIVEGGVPAHRQRQGWSSEINYGSARIHVAASVEKLPRKLMEDLGSDTVHVISGIGSTSFQRSALMTAQEGHALTLIYVEPWQITSLPRRMNWQIRTRQRIRRLAGTGVKFLSTGQEGIHQIKKAGVSPNDIAPFAYWLPTPVRTLKTIDVESKFDLLYVGSFYDFKNILPLARAVAQTQLTLKVVGTGVLKEAVASAARASGGRIELLGSLPNHEVRQLMTRAEFLVLPSQYDGWGAVVSEALLAGTRVLVSTAAGSSQVVSSPSQGYQFTGNRAGIIQALEWASHQRPSTLDDRLALREWSAASISAEAGAEYFDALVDAWRKRARLVASPPIPPWIKSCGA